MKKTNLLIVLSLILALVVAAWSPTPAQAGASGPTNLSIGNKTGMPVTITLTGPKNYTIMAAPGNSTKEIAGGQYKYSYKACGINKTGTIKTKGAKTKLNIAACKTAIIVIVNRSDQTLFVNLTGPYKYSYTLLAETALPVKVVRGVYRGTGTVCGQSFSREVQAVGARYVWTFYPCP
jgi:hypothetical protein